VQLTLDFGMLCLVSVLRLIVGMGCIYRRARLPWIHPKMSIVRNPFCPATAASSRALDHLVVILLLGMNLNIWWNLQEDRTVADPTVSMAQERRGADPDMILPHMGHLAYIGGLWGSAADFACLRDGASSGKASGQVAGDHSTRRKPGLATRNEHESARENTPGTFEYEYWQHQPRDRRNTR
jgi:hypothetical protein